MTKYYIRKTSNGDYREIEKKFVLNTSEYLEDSNTLYFSVENQDIPFLIDYDMFFNVMSKQIQKGLFEFLTFDNGLMQVSIRDGNIIKNYTFDFNITDNDINFNRLKKSIYKLVSIYKENPNSYELSEQKYRRLIFDIFDGDRIPVIEDKEELLRIFEVYNANKNEFLNILLSNVVFCNDDGNIIDYQDKFNNRRINSIKYAVYNQMEAAMLHFCTKNNASRLYQEYLNNLYIPIRNIVYQYVDDNGNIFEMPKKLEEETALSLSRDLFKQKISNAFNKIKIRPRRKK